MPLTQIGPGAFMDLSLPAYRKMQPWTAPGEKSPLIIADPSQKSPARSATRVVARTPTKSMGKSGLSWPEISTVHPINLPQGMLREEFNELYSAMEKADRAPGTYSPEQQAKRDTIGERVDLLRPFVWG